MGKSRQAEHQALVDWQLGESRAMLACLSTTVVAAVGKPEDQLVVLPARGGTRAAMRSISSSGVSCISSALAPRLSEPGSLCCLAQRYNSSAPPLRDSHF
jgi:hypothetical protein